MNSLATDTLDSEDKIVGQHWDVLIIGTGMGGATLGYRVAKAGKRVLFCEKGRSNLAFRDSIKDGYPEQYQNGECAPLNSTGTRVLQRAGRYCEAIVDSTASKAQRSIPFIGAGTGGSSALYGMALERFFPADFTPRSNHPLAHETSLEESWPISYEALAPYYAEAEALYRLRGTADPLRMEAGQRPNFRDVPTITSGAAELVKFFESKDLHPYRLPMACEFVVGCQACQGFLCGRNCKNDSSRICLQPALQQFNASILDQCEVVSIEADRSQAKSVVCRMHGREFRIHAKVIVLAAGALQSPNLLFRSKSTGWPDGLANQSGLLGRNLMRHFIDLYLVKPQTGEQSGFDNRFKEIAFNDFYQNDGIKLGSVQSFGRLPPASMLFTSMKQDFRNSNFAWAGFMFAFARPFLIPILNRLVLGATALATTIEDLPYLENRVYRRSIGNGDFDLAIEYRIKPEGRQRIRRIRELMRTTLASRRWRLVRQAENNQRLAHVCGTCRFGINPKTSVLDVNNRVHNLENLYVVDSSFFPSSGGTNPSLTIAANALRVADHLTR